MENHSKTLGSRCSGKRNRGQAEGHLLGTAARTGREPVAEQAALLQCGPCPVADSTVLREERAQGRNNRGFRFITDASFATGYSFSGGLASWLNGKMAYVEAVSVRLPFRSSAQRTGLRSFTGCAYPAMDDRPFLPIFFTYHTFYLRISYHAAFDLKEARACGSSKTFRRIKEMPSETNSITGFAEVLL